MKNHEFWWKSDSRQMVYVNFQNPTCPRDFPGTDFLIFRNLLYILSFDPIDMKYYRCVLWIWNWHFWWKTMNFDENLIVGRWFMLIFKTLPALGTSLGPISWFLEICYNILSFDPIDMKYYRCVLNLYRYVLTF